MAGEINTSKKMDTPVFFIKFCEKKEYAQDILQGRLYTNSAEYFRLAEIKSGKRGQGDKDELIYGFPFENLTCVDRSSKKEVFRVKVGHARLNWDSDNNKAMVSFIAFRRSQLDNVGEENGAELYSLQNYSQEFTSLSKQFGKYCVVMNATELVNRIENYCNDRNIGYRFGDVIYVSDHSEQQGRAFFEQDPDRFLYKNDFFKNQSECRLAMDIDVPEDHYINIGKLKKAQITKISSDGTMNIVNDF